MAGSDLALHVWKKWGLHILVLLSFTLQVELRILAELRRRIDSSVLRSFIWAAYLLADSTAIYVLGHLSVTSRSPEHELMAFWAPFLLLHLGGQDNITAYAIEDNQLWLRHLQTLSVQVPAAAYVLYHSSILSSSRTLSVRVAAILMFVVGVVKYGERVWALSCAGTISSGNNYRSFQRPKGVSIDIIPCAGRRDTEALLSVAYLLLPVPVDLLIAPLSSEVAFHGILHGEEVYKVVEMQLSLMHDIFYTKAVVTYSPYGLCIRLISLTSTAVALLLFRHQLSVGRHHLQQQDSTTAGYYTGVDVAVTHVLLYGAIVLEIASATRAVFSSWTRVILVRRSARSEMMIWSFLSQLVASVRRLVHAVVAPRYWPATIGQHNLLKSCARSRASRCSKIARWMGLEDPWNILAYSTSIPVSTRIEQLLVNQVLKRDNPDGILNSRGRGALKSWGRGLYEAAGEMELDESILVWHIATDVYLSWYKQQPASGSDDHAQQAAQALSNYMLFLLAAHPYMLPPPASRNAYVETCYGLAGVEYRSAEDLANLLLRYGRALNGRGSWFQFPYIPGAVGIDYSISNNTALQRGCQLGAKLIGVESTAADTLELIAKVWAEMLCYAGYRCSGNSHAKQLSNGGELITIAALLVGYIKRRTPAVGLPISNPV